MMNRFVFFCIFSVISCGNDDGFLTPTTTNNQQQPTTTNNQQPTTTNNNQASKAAAAASEAAKTASEAAESTILRSKEEAETFVASTANFFNDDDEQSNDLPSTTELADLPSTTELALGAPHEDMNAATVGKTTILSFVARLTGQMKQDVLDSVQFSQAVTKKKLKSKPNVTPMTYFKTFSDVMTNIGWIEQNSSVKTFKSSASSFTVDEVVLDVLGALLDDPTEMALLESTLKSLKKLAKDGKITAFEDNSVDIAKNGFTLGLASESNGDPVMRFVGLNMGTHSHETNILVATYRTKDMHVESRSEEVVLNSGAYPRDAISKMNRKIMDEEINKYFLEDL